MEPRLNDTLHAMLTDFGFLKSELILASGIMVLVIVGLFKPRAAVLHLIALAFLLITSIAAYVNVGYEPRLLFGGIVRSGGSFSDFFKLLFASGGALTVAMTWRGEQQRRLSEYYALLLAVILGANFLVMSENLLVLFLSLELVSISSYVLTGFSFEKKSSEGSLKYFLFGSVASAVMLYGFTIMYGLFGTLNYPDFQLPSVDSSQLYFIAAVLSLAGFLYKIAAAPLHPWAPDVYQAAPMPIVAFFSVVPKLAGVGILLKFSQLTRLPITDLKLMLAGVAILTLTVGNFAALWQKNVKRLMAYSSIGQSGFLLVGIVSGSTQSAEFLLFYSTVYLILTFLIFFYVQKFEMAGATTIADYAGIGRTYAFAGVMMLIGFIALTGLPPTAGFTGKLFLFSALWESYTTSDEGILLALLIFGLLNTVVSLFYYLRIPYFTFIQKGETTPAQNNLTFENLLCLILVLAVLVLFFSPGLLMGWINKTNFAF